jgi:hypothetical protein
MGMSSRWALAVLAVCALAACRREEPATPAKAPATPAPATSSAPAPAASAAPAAAPAPASSTAAAASGSADAQKPAAPTAPASPLEAVAVTSTTLGAAINADKRVSVASDTFRPGDTIFLTVETSGTGGAGLTARWTFDPDGQAVSVNAETQKVAPGGASVTEFHVRKPDGWPPGTYQVQVLVNSDVVATKRFKVK